MEDSERCFPKGQSLREAWTAHRDGAGEEASQQGARAIVFSVDAAEESIAHGLVLHQAMSNFTP